MHKGYVVREELAANLGFFLACLRAKPVSQAVVQEGCPGFLENVYLRRAVTPRKGKDGIEF